jgi:hypothetical protein
MKMMYKLHLDVSKWSLCFTKQDRALWSIPAMDQECSKPGYWVTPPVLTVTFKPSPLQMIKKERKPLEVG